MTLTNIRIKALGEALTWLAEAESKSARFSFRVGHALTVLDPVLKTLEQAERAAYLRYVEKDEDDKPVMDEETGQPKFTDAAALEEALSELFETETEIQGITKFTLEDFEAAAIVPKGRRMAALLPIIAVPTDEE